MTTTSATTMRATTMRATSRAPLRRSSSSVRSRATTSTSTLEVTPLVQEETTRRSALVSLGAMAALAMGGSIEVGAWVRPNAARADEDDEELAEVEANMKAVMEKNSGEQTFAKQVGLSNVDGVRACSFEVSSLWQVGDTSSKGLDSFWGAIVDPVNGEAVTNARMFAAPNFRVSSIDDLGKVEDVQVAKALGLDGDDSYRRADMLGAAKRVDKSTGQVYYDWELIASPPPSACPSAVGCLYPEHIYLISASVLNGVLYVLSLDATPAQWRVTGNSVKRIRNSFTVGYDAPAPADAATETETSSSKESE